MYELLKAVKGEPEEDEISEIPVSKDKS